MACRGVHRWLLTGLRVVLVFGVRFHSCEVFTLFLEDVPCIIVMSSWYSFIMFLLGMLTSWLLPGGALSLRMHGMDVCRVSNL